MFQQRSIWRPYKTLNVGEDRPGETVSSFRKEFETLPAWKRSFVAWGLLIITIQFLAWLLPQGPLLHAPFILSILYIITISFRISTPFPRTFPFVIALVLQLWSCFTSVYASRYLGRPIQMGRAENYPLYAITFGVIAYTLCMIMPILRRIIRDCLVGVFAASAIVAWLQFVRFPIAMNLARIYTYKSIDNWDGHAGIRAVGLTVQPNYLGFQAVIGLAFVASVLSDRRLRNGEYALLALFTGAGVFSQSRAALVPLAIVGVFTLYKIFRFSRRDGFRVLVALALAGLMAVPIAAKRFQYLIMATSGSDSSMSTRATKTWAQLDPILPRLPLTGIGPSSGLLLGTGPEDKWVPEGRVVESGYLLFQAMYGMPGVGIMILGLVGGMAFALRKLARTRESMQRELLIVGSVCCLSILINCSSFNTFDTYLHFPLAMLIAGMASISFDREKTRTWRGFGFSRESLASSVELG